jgi:hypothetical protein
MEITLCAVTKYFAKGNEFMEIRKVMDHYEVYDNGKFLFSADNKKEIKEELAAMQKGN